jgi:hypothetical protein
MVPFEIKKEHGETDAVAAAATVSGEPRAIHAIHATGDLSGSLGRLCKAEPASQQTCPPGALCSGSTHADRLGTAAPASPLRANWSSPARPPRSGPATPPGQGRPSTSICRYKLVPARPCLVAEMQPSIPAHQLADQLLDHRRGTRYLADKSHRAAATHQQSPPHASSSTRQKRQRFRYTPPWSALRTWGSARPARETSLLFCTKGRPADVSLTEGTYRLAPAGLRGVSSARNRSRCRSRAW